MLLIAAVLVLLKTSAGGSFVQGAYAQPGDGIDWGTPELAFENSEGVWYSEPTAVLDANSDVNLFFGVAGPSVNASASASVGGQIFHTARTDFSWQPATDIVAGSAGSAFVKPRVRLDETGRFNLSWSGGSGTSPEYWSTADSSMAHSPLAWDAAKPVTHDVAYDADLVLTENGDKHILYAVTGAGMSSDTRGVHHAIISGESTAWSSSDLIAEATDSHGISELRAAVDARDCIHVAWSETPLTGYPPSGIFYATSCDNGRAWSPSTPLFGPDFGNPRIATVRENEIHVTALGRVGMPGSRHRWSADGGLTWSNEDVIEASRQGLSGAGLASDSAGRVHFVYAGSDQQQIWSTTWTGESWTSPRPIAVDLRPGEGRIFEQVSLNVGQGNRLLVAFQEFSAKADEQRVSKIWFVEGQADSPLVQPEIVHRTAPPVATPVAEVSPAASLAASVTASSPTAVAPAKDRPEQANGAYPVLVSTLLSGSLVAAALLWRAYRVGRR